MHRLLPLLLALVLPMAALAQQPPGGRGPPPGGMGPPPPGAPGMYPSPPPPPPPPPQYQQQANVEQAAQPAPVEAAPVVAPAAVVEKQEPALPKPVEPFDELDNHPPPPPLEFGKSETPRSEASKASATIAPAGPPRLVVMPQSLPGWLWLVAGAAVLSFLGWRASARRSQQLEAEAQRLARDQRQLKSAHVQLKTQSEQLRQLATNDPLTGVLNRQGFAAELRTALEHLARFHRPLNLMLIDMDNFKQINDRLGHLAGDQALKLVVGVARQHLDSEHLFGRFGGDEFMIACADETLDASAGLAESIRAGVVRAAAEHEPPLTGLSLSIGIAQANEEFGYRTETLFHRADTALYAAKHSGRNRVVLSDESLPPPPVLEAATRHLA